MADGTQGFRAWGLGFRVLHRPLRRYAARRGRKHSRNPRNPSMVCLLLLDASRQEHHRHGSRESGVRMVWGFGSLNVFGVWGCLGGFRARGFGLRRRKLGPREPSQDCLSQVVGWETAHGPKPDACPIAVWGEGVMQPYLALEAFSARRLHERRRRFKLGELRAWVSQRNELKLKPKYRNPKTKLRTVQPLAFGL